MDLRMENAISRVAFATENLHSKYLSYPFPQEKFHLQKYLYVVFIWY